MFEPLWNRNFIDHIQFSVAESVGVEGRGGYYDRSGVLRDMLQNHMFQMLAYLCMEPPGSFAPEAVRNEKAKVLECRAHDGRQRRCAANTVRGQYGAGTVPTASRRPATARSPACRPIPGPKPSRRCGCTSTTGDGTACPSISAPASGCGSAAPKSSCSSKPRPDVLFRGHRRRIARTQPADFSHPAGPGHRAASFKPRPRARDAAAESEHAVRLRRGLHGFPRHRLRSADLQLHERRRHACSRAPTWWKPPGGSFSP